MLYINELPIVVKKKFSTKNIPKRFDVPLSSQLFILDTKQNNQN